MKTEILIEVESEGNPDINRVLSAMIYTTIGDGENSVIVTSAEVVRDQDAPAPSMCHDCIYYVYEVDAYPCNQCINGLGDSKNYFTPKKSVPAIAPEAE